MPETRDNQAKDVAIGLAVGTYAQGVSAVTSRKASLEPALAAAWERWSQAPQFAAIGTSNDPGTLLAMAIRRSSRRRMACAAWASDQWTRPVLNNNWDVEDCLAHLDGDNQTSAAHWIELGRLFIQEFKPDELIYRVD
jgi:hypothetical protein